MINDDIKKTVAGRIKSAIAKNHISQKYLAECIGKKHCIVSYWCSGERTPNAEDLIRLSTELNVSTDYLLGLTDYSGRDEVVKQIIMHPIIIDNLRKLNSSIQWLQQMVMSNAFVIDDSCETTLRLALQYAFPNLFDGEENEEFVFDDHVIYTGGTNNAE